MLNVAQVKPYQIAYDKPSSKLVAFLDKHYGLREEVQQTNNFVVFREYFEGSQAKDMVYDIYTKRYSNAKEKLNNKELFEKVTVEQKGKDDNLRRENYYRKFY